MATRKAMPVGGEIAVIGFGKSGAAAVRLLRIHDRAVYASDVSSSDAARETARALEALGADVTIGGHDLDRIARASLVVVSPGVPPNAPPIAAARDRGVEVVSEIELALRYMSDIPYIAVTGTNGKTTTTALIGHLLRALGHTVADAGNIGTPLTEIIVQAAPPEWLALELSSFQLHDTPSVDPVVGVLTNLSPDHLDRYATIEEYYADKMLLFANASEQSVWVLNGDDPTSMLYTATIAGVRHYFSTVNGEHSPLPDAWYDRSAATLTVLGDSVIPRAEFPLLGDHNVANALAAVLAVQLASPAHRTAEVRTVIGNALRTFRAPPHRLELVGEWDGVQWINDSKATNVSSTYVAVDGMTRPTILLLGGRHKGEPYTALATPIRAHVKRVIAYGESAQIVEHDLRDIVAVDRLGSDFESVMAHARQLAEPGDAVLLSPACSSYDMFKNYEDRGAQFRALANGSAQGSAQGGVQATGVEVRA